MFKPEVKIIADSINECGNRLTTFVLTYHRFIHSELMTYRQFSRNCSSSRAIPVNKTIAKVKELNLYPLHWGANQKGMQAYEEVDDATQLLAMGAWDDAREACIKSVERLVELGVHKQVANRLLEPFNTITTVVTATDVQNFFDQRCHPDSQPEIKVLADLMKETYELHKPTLVGQDAPILWHIPFLTRDDWELWALDELNNQDLIKISTGRCARVSYLNHDGKRDIEADIALHDRLLSADPPHLSPFEHCAIAMPTSERYANFTGWKSYRNILEMQ